MRRSLLLPLVVIAPVLLAGQGRRQASSAMAEVPYDGDFTFSRVRYGGPGFRRGGAAWSPDEGETWNELPEFLDFWAVSFANHNAGWMVGGGGRIVKISF